MANSYIQVRDETMSAGTYLRVSVLWSDFSEGPVAQQVADRSASGELLVSIGKAFRIWTGVFKVSHSPASQYASKENIETWATSSSAAKRRLTMRTNLWTQPAQGQTSPHEYSVFITSLSPSQYSSPVPDGTNSYYYIPFEIQTRSST